MRGRTRSKLLTGGVAILGLSLGAAGCQSRGPLLGLSDGDAPRLLAGTSAPTILREPAAPEAQGVTQVQAVAQTAPPERASSRPIFSRLMRPTPVHNGGSAPIAQVGPPTALSNKPIIASTWAPMQRGEPPVPVAATLAAAAYQGNQQQGDQGKPIPMPMPREAVTPPEAGQKPKAEPEPGLLTPPKPMPAETTPPPIGEVPMAQHALPPAGFPKAPVETSKVSLPPYVIEPPDILLVETILGFGVQEVKGQHLVRPDGTINLGIFGPVYVAGMTVEQAREAVAQTIVNRLEPSKVAEMRKERKREPGAQDVSVDVLAYNSKVYYVITDGGGYGEQVRRFPITGSETVLDAISNIEGLPAVASKKKIWVARRTPGDHGPPQLLPVNWIGVTQGAQVATNYQVMPGDRIYVHSQGLVRLDSKIGKILSPIERLFGGALLGSQTVNSIRFPRASAFGNNPGFVP